MASIKIAGFAGENRAIHPKLLPDTVGAVSRNQKPGRGDLRPWRAPLQTATVPAGRRTLYRFGRDVVSDAQYWFSWTSVVHAVRSMVGDDTTERTYYTGDGAPKWTDNTMGPGAAGTAMPQAWRQLGVPRPVSAINATAAAAGSATTQSVRYYVYTYVTDKGEESAPSPVSNYMLVNDDATMTLANITAAPSGQFTINRIRIYRTQTGSTGIAEFFFLREVAGSATGSTDDNRALGEILPTEGWLPPPEDLTYLTAMWNGMMAGISGNAARYCVAYKPYAWPAAYETMPPDAKAVGLATFGQSLLVLTTARPVVVSGTSPDSLNEEPVEFSAACIAPRGIVSFGHGVAWPSSDGLAYVGAGGARYLTTGLLTRDDWLAMNPAGMVGGVYEGAYLGFFTDAGGVRRGFLIDPRAPTGIFYLDQGYDALYVDELQDALYVLDGQAVKRWDAGAAMMTARFVSKVFVSPAPTGWAWARVVADAYPVTCGIAALGLDPKVAAKLIATYPTRIAAYGTGVLFTQTVTGPQPFRLPPMIARDWQVDASTAGAVQGIALAQSTQDLQQ